MCTKLNNVYRIVIVVILVLFTSPKVEAQSLDTTFTKILSAPDFDVANDLFFTSDSNLIIVGNSSSFNTLQPDAFILKTDVFGNPKWLKSYGESEIEQFHAIIESADFHYWAVGTSNNESSTDYNALITKTDSSGNLIKSVEIGYEGWDVANGVTETQNGTIVICGTTHKNGFEEGWVVALNPATLEVEMEFTVGTLSNFNRITSQNSTLFACGELIDETTSISNGFVVSLDLFGNENWRSDFGRTQNDFLNDLVFRLDGFLHTVGTSQNPFDDRTSPIVGVLDPANGQVTFQDVWLGSVINTLNGCAISKFDTIAAVAGTTHDILAKTDALVAFSNFNGGFLPASTHSSPEYKDEFGKKIVFTDFGYYMIGNTYGWQAEYSDILLVKTDTFGLVDFSNIITHTLTNQQTVDLTSTYLSAVDNSPENQLTIFPNPISVGSRLSIQSEITSTNNLTVRILSLAGTVIAESENQLFIDIPDFLSRGVYLIEITNGSYRKTHREKLIIQ